jgi:thymidylate synthase (FAD)
MILRKMSVELLDTNKQGEDLIEVAARTCYKSEDKICPGSYRKMIERLKKNKHFAMLEFCWFCVRITCDRALSHQLVRHRHFSFAQESQHYIKYKDDVQFVPPIWVHIDNGLYDKPLNRSMTIMTKSNEEWTWFLEMLNAEQAYLKLIAQGAKACEARAMLPNSAKTELVMAGNGRSWLEFMDKRLGIENTKEMSALAAMILDKVFMEFPTLLLDK